MEAGEGVGAVSTLGRPGCSVPAENQPQGQAGPAGGGPGTGLEPRALSSMPGKARLSGVLLSGIRDAIGVGALFVGSMQVCLGRAAPAAAAAPSWAGSPWSCAQAPPSQASGKRQCRVSLPRRETFRGPVGRGHRRLHPMTRVAYLLTVGSGLAARLRPRTLGSRGARVPSLGSGVGEPPALGLPLHFHP